jgi:hypothetical protein
LLGLERLQRLPCDDRAHLHRRQKILVLLFALPFVADHEGSMFLLPVLLKPVPPLVQLLFLVLLHD